MKRIICLLLCWVLMASVAEADVEINADNFPDENFRQWVKERVGGDVLTDAKIDGLQKIEIEESRGISSLKGIEHFKSLESLLCVDNPIRKLDLSENTLLNVLVCPSNQLETLKLPKKTKLERLLCQDNNLKKLDVSRCAALSELDCSGNPIKELDLSKNRELRELTLPKTGTVTLYNGDKIDAKDFLPRKTSGGKYRLDLSRYAGNINNVCAYKIGPVNHIEVPVEVSGGVYTFEPCDGQIWVMYRLGEGDDDYAYLRLYLLNPLDEESGSGKTGTPDQDEDDFDERPSEEPEEPPIEKPAGGSDEHPSKEKDDDDYEERPSEKPDVPDVDDDEEEEVAEEHINLSVKLVNNTDAKVFVAIVGKADDSEASFSKGWWSVEPNAERTIGFGELNEGFSFGFYATSKGGKRVWAARADDPKCLGSFWIHPKNAFSSIGEPIKGGKQVNFKRLNVKDDGNATIKFAVK